MIIPAISVIIPAFNAEKTIRRCIESIQAQVFTNFEVIVVDDGSEDCTFGIASEMCKADNRIHLYSQSNNGVSSARNCGLSKADGKYIMFVDSDDYIQPQYLQTYFESAIRQDADVVIGGCTRFEQVSKKATELVPPVEGDITDNIWMHLTKDASVYGFVCSKLIRRELIENNNIRYNERMYSQEDLSFNLDVYDKAKKIFAILDTGYIYEYSVSNRRPDLIGYSCNQLKLRDICYRKQVLTCEMENAIHSRLETYCFGYLMYAEDRKLAVNELQAIEGLTDVLGKIKIRSEKDYVCWMLAHTHNNLVVFYLTARDKIKALLHRGNE